MKLTKCPNGKFSIGEITKEELKVIHNLIMSAQLPDRRVMFSLKTDIEKVQ